MNAKFNDKANTKFVKSHRKEGKCYFNCYSALVPYTNFEGKPDLTEVVSARMYGTDTMWYCALWVRSDKVHTQGTGSAGGGGYHKPSSALGEAIRNAGIELDKDISGVGESAMIEAIQAIAVLAGYDNAIMHYSHP